MKKTKLSLIIISLAFLANAYSQTEKSTKQAGISVLPIYDILNTYPDNKIAGGAVMGNFGFFVMNDLSIGLMPYYGQVSNKYNISTFDFHEERQDISLYGLNTYMRYYFFKKKKVLVYASASFGFGNIHKQTTNLAIQSLVDYSESDDSVYTILAGLGVNYSLSPRISLELNIPYTVLRHISGQVNDSDFQTIAPMIGVQYNWN